MHEIYKRIDTTPFFPTNTTEATLEYVVFNSIKEMQGNSAAHNIAEINFCAKGSCTFVCFGKTYTMHKGDLIIANPYEEHNVTANTAGADLYIFGINNMQFDLSESNTPFFHIGENNILFKYISLLIDELGCQSPAVPDVSAIQSLWKIILKKIESETTLSTKPFEKANASNTIVSVANYIDTHFNRELTVDDLSKMFYCAKSTLMHSFKKTYGKSIFNYIIDRRLEEVKMWLKNSNISINKIALSNGFSSVSFFHKCFKKSEGVTPSEYRKSVQKMAKLP